MNRARKSLWIAAGFLVAGCSRSPREADAQRSPTPAPTADAAPVDVAPAPTKTLTIRWQRLITEAGGTCARCTGTEGAIREAERTLSPALGALGIRVVVEEGALDMGTFKGNPSESNRIWIGGRTLEEILGASAGSSQCCGACGDSECRTLVLEGQTYEAVPATLIVVAALRAAADLLGPSAQEPGSPPAEPAAPGGSCGCGAAPAAPAPSCGCGAAPVEPTPCYGSH